MSVLVATSSLAQRLSFQDFPGAGSAARDQLVGKLCEQAECIAPAKVTKGNKPDLKKAKKEGVGFIVSGAVSKKGKSLDLTVVAVGKTLAVKLKKSFALDQGSLSESTLKDAAAALREVMGIAEPPEPKPAPKPEPKPEPAPTPAASASEPKSQPTPAATATAAEPAPSSGKKKPIFLAIELGSDIVNRHFDYVNQKSDNVRKYDLLAFPMPMVKLEFNPLALMRDDLLAGLGIDGAFGFAPFLKSRPESGSVVFPTSAMRVDGGLHWRIKPVPTFGLGIIPFVGIRLQSFTVAAASTGEKLDGLPNLSFFGLRAGLGLEVPIIPDLIILIGRFAVLPVFSSGEIISSAYFPKGSNFGLEAGGGLAVQVVPFLQLRVSFEYLNYGLTFKPQDGDTYVADGAADRYLGGNAALRLQF